MECLSAFQWGKLGGDVGRTFWRDFRSLWLKQCLGFLTREVSECCGGSRLWYCAFSGSGLFNYCCFCICQLATLITAPGKKKEKPPLAPSRYPVSLWKLCLWNLRDVSQLNFRCGRMWLERTRTVEAVSRGRDLLSSFKSWQHFPSGRRYEIWPVVLLTAYNLEIVFKQVVSCPSF